VSVPTGGAAPSLPAFGPAGVPLGVHAVKVAATSPKPNAPRTGDHPSNQTRLVRRMLTDATFAPPERTTQVSRHPTTADERTSPSTAAVAWKRPVASGGFSQCPSPA